MDYADIFNYAEKFNDHDRNEIEFQKQLQYKSFIKLFYIMSKSMSV